MTDDLLTLTSDIVSAHVGHNLIDTAELPALIRSTFAALQKLGQPVEPEAVAPQPAVSVRASIKPGYLVCLEDGKKLTMLKRYLRTYYDMSPNDYRAKWGLPRDYPMVAPDYAAKRRTLAQAMGLGRKRAVAAVETIVTDATETVEAAAEPIVALVKAGRRKLGIAVAKDTADHPGGEVSARKVPRPRVSKAD